MSTASTTEITVAGRTLTVHFDAPRVDPQPGQVLLRQGPHSQHVRTGCDIIGVLSTPEGHYSQVHRHRDGTFFVYGWVAPRSPRAGRHSTPEEAVSATLADYYSNRYVPTPQA